MLPPVEESVLQNNPEFAALYSTLTTAILNPDGTTKDDQSRAARERDAVRKVFPHSYSFIFLGSCADFKFVGT